MRRACATATRKGSCTDMTAPRVATAASAQVAEARTIRPVRCTAMPSPPELWEERQALKRARHRRRRSKLYRAWLGLGRTRGRAGYALAPAERVGAGPERRKRRLG